MELVVIVSWWNIDGTDLNPIIVKSPYKRIRLRILSNDSASDSPNPKEKNYVVPDVQRHGRNDLAGSSESERSWMVATS